eukprot:Phypoly_transcript_06092.p1 GENE.Phypoly_transcript_06092~~Phypoly_transcript_06092.p1  ORF type:complete len:530 (+),score=73.11 Phypoly_transcript_06092:159-1748(+)
MFWTFIILGILGLVAWGVGSLYQVIVMRQVKDFKDIHGNQMKGTKPTFLIGDVLSEYLFPHSLTSKAFLRYGDVYYRWFFWKPTLMVVDHEGIHKVLNDTDAYRKNTPVYQAFAENAELADQSDTIKDVFNPEHMEILGDSVLNMAQSFCDQLVDSQGNGVAFSVYNTSIAYTREVLGTVLYGDTFSARQIMTAQRELSNISSTRAFIRKAFPTLAKMAPSYFGIEQAAELSAGLTSSISSPGPDTVLGYLHDYRKKKDKKRKKGAMGDEEEEKLEEDEEEFDKHRHIRMEDEIKAKNKLIRQDSETETEEKERSDGLRLKQSISNVIAFYTTGLDTTASVLTSTFYMLMIHQDIQSQLREAIIKALDGQPASYSKLKSVKLLTYVIKETLRLHPPYPILYPRVSRRSDRLAGFHIPKKTNVIVDVVGHNRHPKYWSNPDSFDPSRFEKHPAATKYVLVWGSGPQEKVGRALGLLVLRCTIATLLLRYQIVCGATDPAHKASRVKFERWVGSLRPTPDLIGQVTEISSS